MRLLNSKRTKVKLHLFGKNKKVETAKRKVNKTTQSISNTNKEEMSKNIMIALAGIAHNQEILDNKLNDLQEAVDLLMDICASDIMNNFND